jgi:hypothetical protein
MIQDPSGLLDRVPELRSLCDDARVRAAVESGDPFAVYRALVLGRLTGRLRSQREVVKTLLRNRRLFAKPMKSGTGPFLGTFNGFGATLMGASEKDGPTHIATHVAVGLFFLPLFPFAAYLVEPGQGGALRRSWRLYARVPLTLGTWLWQRTLSVAALLAIAYGGYQAFYASRHHTLHVVNGLGQPVHVTVGAAKLDLPPGGRQVVDLPVGTASAVARTGSGVEADRQEIPIKSGSHTLVWNVGGAAPLYLQAIRYHASSASAREEEGPPPVVYCGQPVVSVDDVDFRFVEPPSSVSMPKSSSVVVKHLLAVAPTPGRQGVELCAGYLVGEGKVKEALPVLELATRTSGWEPRPTWSFLMLVSAIAPERALPLAEEAIQAKPDSVLLHRIYQTLASYRMSETELQARYRTRAEAAPKSADAQYLSIRLQRGPEGADAARAALKRFPDSPQLLRFVLLADVSSGRYAQAREGWQRLLALSMEEAGYGIDEGMTALVALGRVPEARTQLLESFPRWEPGAQVRAAILDARLASISRGSDGDRLLKKLDGKTVDAVLSVRAGLPGALESAPKSPFQTFLHAVLTDPAKVPSLADSLTPMDVTRLSEAEWALSWAECVRVGDQTCRRKLEASSHSSAYDLADTARFLRGESSSLGPMLLDPAFRAAALLVRSRSASLPADRDRWIAEARHTDWLHDEITDAVPAWTRAAAR